MKLTNDQNDIKGMPAELSASEAFSNSCIYRKVVACKIDAVKRTGHAHKDIGQLAARKRKS